MLAGHGHVKTAAYIVNDDLLDTVFYGIDIKVLQGISILPMEGQGDTLVDNKKSYSNLFQMEHTAIGKRVTE